MRKKWLKMMGAVVTGVWFLSLAELPVHGAEALPMEAGGQETVMAQAQAEMQAAVQAQAAAQAEMQAQLQAAAQAALQAQARAEMQAQAQAAAQAEMQAQAQAAAQAALQAQQQAAAQAAAQAQKDAAAQAAVEAQAALQAQIAGRLQELALQQLEAAAENQTPVPAPVVLIGDSRFVQMQEAVGPNPCAWVASSGQGYKWLEESALARADRLIGGGTRVLINLGVNDTRNADKYLALINAKAAEWVQRGAVVYYASVNPVWTNPHVTKEQVEAFNTRLQAGLAPYIQWIDSYHYLLSTGMRLVDGLHFVEDTSRRIYTYYMAALFASQPSGDLPDSSSMLQSSAEAIR